MNATKRLGRAAKIGASAAATRKSGKKVKHKAWPKFGVQCFACKQRIKPLTHRRPLTTEDNGKVWLHSGCNVAAQP